MSTTNKVLWPLEPHTRGKHLVLKAYLDQWLPILGSWCGRIVFIDGFAGPGEYAGGEAGSPIIALDTFTGHMNRGVIRAEVLYLFIEGDAARAEHLRQLLAPRHAMLPPNCKLHVVHGRFDETMTTMLDQIEQGNGAGKRLAPTLLMVDPFGVSDTPMHVIARVLKNPQAEVYVSFMYEAINRFKGTPEFEPHMDALFGTSEWRQALGVAESEERKRFLFTLYREQLKQAGARHVVHFELYNGNRLVYAIFHATKHAKGCDAMKQAIWKATTGGEYAFRGSRTGQELLTFGPDLARFSGELCARLRAPAYTPVEALESFAQSDETNFHSGHLRKALAELERAARIEVDPTSRKRRFTYPIGTRIRLTNPAAGSPTAGD